jgi:hypothetical protein
MNAINIYAYKYGSHLVAVSAYSEDESKDKVSKILKTLPALQHRNVMEYDTLQVGEYVYHVCPETTIKPKEQGDKK